MAGEMTLDELAKVAADAWFGTPLGHRASKSATRAIVLRIAEWLDATQPEESHADHVDCCVANYARVLRALADPAGRGE
jgi:hypothetical protein